MVCKHVNYLGTLAFKLFKNAIFRQNVLTNCYIRILCLKWSGCNNKNNIFVATETR